MISLILLISTDAPDWQTYVVENAAASAAELERWLAESGPWNLYLIWPNQSERTITLLAYGRRAEPPRAIESALRDQLRTTPFGRLAAVSATPMDDDDLIREANLQAFAAFPGPGGRCPGCGKATPPHHRGCPFGR